MQGVTPLMCAAWRNYPKVAEWLLSRGADPELKDTPVSAP